MKPDLLKIVEKNIGKIVTIILKDNKSIKARIIKIDILNKNVIVATINKKTETNDADLELSNHISNQAEIPFNWIKGIG